MMEFDDQKLIEMRRHLKGFLSLVELLLEQKGILRCHRCLEKHQNGQCRVKT